MYYFCTVVRFSSSEGDYLQDLEEQKRTKYKNRRGILGDHWISEPIPAQYRYRRYRTLIYHCTV